MGGEVFGDRSENSVAGVGYDRADTYALDLAVAAVDLYLESRAVHLGVELHAPPVSVPGKGRHHRPWLITAEGGTQSFGGLDRCDGGEGVVDWCAVMSTRLQRCATRQT
ncbi:hypothetical protein A8M60_03385 [Nocardia farcinica]|nr:hypothetical protein A8M60_03385 [Nocardia farcinica]